MRLVLVSQPEAAFLKSSVNNPYKLGSSSLGVPSRANALGQAVLPALVQRVLRYLRSAARKVLMRETGSSAAKYCHKDLGIIPWAEDNPHQAKDKGGVGKG